MVERSEDDAGLLADEKLDVGDDLVQDDGDLSRDGLDFGNGQIRGSETLYAIKSGISTSCTTMKTRKGCNVRSCWVRGVNWVVASAKI